MTVHELIDNYIAHELQMSGALESATEVLKHEHTVTVLKRLKSAIEFNQPMVA